MKIILILIINLLFFCSLDNNFVFAQEKIRIATLYNINSKNYKNAIHDAISKHPLKNKINIIDCEYINNADGLEKLNTIIVNGVVNINLFNNPNKLTQLKKNVPKEIIDKINNIKPSNCITIDEFNKQIKDVLSKDEYNKYIEPNLSIILNIDEDKKSDVDMVLGPTDSDVYLRAIEKKEELEKYKIPVISSLVIANDEISEHGYFFRTNVDVERRAEYIYDYFNSYWNKSFAVIYINDGFGRDSEKAFLSNLNPTQKINYFSLPYIKASETKKEIKQIIDRRPAIIGIFGPRQDISEIISSINNKSRKYHYHPIYFSLIDIGDVVFDENVKDIFFVSSLNKYDPNTNKNINLTNNVELNDVYALAHDTTILVLNKIIETQSTDNFDKIKFRNSIVSLLNGSQNKSVETENMLFTDMKFDKFKNTIQPIIYYDFDVGLKYPIAIDTKEKVAFLEKFKKKFEYISRQYGYIPIINIILMLLIVGFFSVMDIKRWYEGNWKKLFYYFHFYLLIIFNALIVVITYVFLAETGKISYNSVLVALIISFTPTAFLRTTFFETETGKNIGLADFYDKILLWINEKLMMAKYESESSNVNVIAYYNSITDMKSELHQIYQNARNVSQGLRLNNELDEELNNAQSQLDKHRVCARRLLRRFDWDELKSKGYIPEAFSQENPVNPRIVVRTSVRHCLKTFLNVSRQAVEQLEKDELPQDLILNIKNYCGNDLKNFDELYKELNKNTYDISKYKSSIEKNLILKDRQDDVHKLIEERFNILKNNNDELFNKMKIELENELNEANSIRGKLFVNLRFLFMEYGFNVITLKNMQLLPRDYEIPKKMNQSLLSTLLNKIKELFISKKDYNNK